MTPPPPPKKNNNNTSLFAVSDLALWYCLTTFGALTFLVSFGVLCPKMDLATPIQQKFLTITFVPFKWKSPMGEATFTISGLAPNIFSFLCNFNQIWSLTAFLARILPPAVTHIKHQDAGTHTADGRGSLEKISSRNMPDTKLWFSAYKEECQIGYSFSSSYELDRSFHAHLLSIEHQSARMAAGEARRTCLLELRAPHISKMSDQPFLSKIPC